MNLITLKSFVSKNMKIENNNWILQRKLFIIKILSDIVILFSSTSLLINFFKLSLNKFSLICLFILSITWIFAGYIYGRYSDWANYKKNIFKKEILKVFLIFVIITFVYFLLNFNNYLNFYIFIIYNLASAICSAIIRFPIINFESRTLLKPKIYYFIGDETHLNLLRHHSRLNNLNIKIKVLFKEINYDENINCYFF